MWRFVTECTFSLVLIKGRAIAEAVSLGPVTAEAQVRSSHTRPCEIDGGQNGTGTGFCREPQFFAVITMPPVPRTCSLICLSTLLQHLSSWQSS